MAGHSRLASTIAVLSLAMLLSVPFPAPVADAGTTCNEGPGEFSKGQLENLVLGPEGLSLGLSNGPLLSNWIEKTPIFSPTPRSYPALAYDSRRGEMVLFGGECQSGTLGDTWIYNCSANKWRLMAPATSPPARQACGMSYDAAHDRMVLFGGYNNSDYLGDTWTYDLGTNVWERKNPQAAPPPRGNFGMVYDSAHELVVLFGGFNRNYPDDMWTYDAGRDTWFQPTPANTPSARSDFAMAYDDESGEIVVFGGYLSGYFLNDTWSYNHTENGWTNRNPASAPSPRAGVSMVYDSGRKQMILYGQYNASCYGSETWTYDPAANTWIDRKPPVVFSARVYYGMAFDSKNNQAILFGGGVSVIEGDTWAYEVTNNVWELKCPSSVPPGRKQHAMAYDSAHGVAVLFGGFNGFSVRLNDTWTYNLSTNRWIEMNPPVAPPGRNEHAMAYDSAHDKVVLFGGYNEDRILNDTWTYDVATNIWTNMSPPAAPFARTGHAMAYDSVQGQVVLFGGGAGSSQYDTWTYNLTVNNWTNMKPQKHPPPRTGPAMTFDPAHDKIILFGGYAYNMLNDTWTYDPTTNTWANMDPPVTPSPRGYISMAWDDSSQKAILFGGYKGGSWPDNCYNDTWSYDPATNTWTNLHPVMAPSPRYHYAIVHDDANGRMVLFGGQAPSTGFSSETWVSGAQTVNVPGYFTSSPRDTGGTAYYGKLSWDADVPENTRLRFQFRAAGSAIYIPLQPFTGPDGTSDTFYDTPGQRIPSTANGTRWFQYRAVFTTDDINYSPLLRKVTVDCNLLQSVQLLSPAGGENWTGVRDIIWSARDPDGDTLRIDLVLVHPSGSTTVLATDLASRSWQWNTTGVANGSYRIRVIARDDNPSISLTVEAFSDNFTIRHPGPAGNQPPSITSAPPMNATEGELYTYNVTASDPDNDPLAFSLVNPVQGMTIDPITGRLSWTPDNAGTFPILVRVSDGRGGTDEQAYSLAVRPSPPACSITYPAGGATVSGTINITGLAARGFRALQKVEVRIDDGNWKPAAGAESWSLRLDTRALATGQHTIRARAYDTRHYSENATVTITVDNAAPVPPRPPRLPEDVSVAENVCPWMILAAVILAIGVSAAVYWRTRKTG